MLSVPFFLQANHHFMKKLPKDAEASNILVGELNGLQSPLSVFIRLNKAMHLGDLTEVPVPTRFLFVLLVPKVRFVYRERRSTLCRLIEIYGLKVRQFQNEFMKSSFLPKYEHKIDRISALCSEGRNLDNFFFVFFE